MPDGEGRKVRNVLPAIARWKIFDNLRRSLVAPSLFIWLVASCTLFPGSPFWWSLFVFLVIAFLVYLHVTTGLLIHPRGIPWTSHFWSIWGDFRTNTAQMHSRLCSSTSDVVDVRCDRSRALPATDLSKKLLEWVSAPKPKPRHETISASFVQFMLPALVLTLIALALHFQDLDQRPAHHGSARRALVNLTVHCILGKQPRPDERKQLTAEDLKFARLITRRTWRFFETFVGPEDNWLPPDNYQEDPSPVIAHRTSPTNIGLLLLATSSARDLGYVGALELVERQELTFSTMAQLNRLHGHFFNWYDTKPSNR